MRRARAALAVNDPRVAASGRTARAWLHAPLERVHRNHDWLAALRA
jgi:hypothetical protein